jgi:ribosomal protein L36
MITMNKATTNDDQLVRDFYLTCPNVGAGSRRLLVIAAYSQTTDDQVSGKGCHPHEGKTCKTVRRRGSVGVAAQVRSSLS